jgi:DNA-binding NarL/FixJ family response regulator
MDPAATKVVSFVRGGAYPAFMTKSMKHTKADTLLTRVLVVDDDPLARTALAMILGGAEGMAVVGQGEDGDEAAPLVAMHAPDVVVMDVKMPRMDGLAATASVRALPNAPRVVVLVELDQEQPALDAIEAGASGIVFKGASPAQIVEGIRVVASGGAALPPSCAMALIRQFVASRVCPRRQRSVRKLELLSAREREVVAAVARGRSNAEIARELWMTEATVKTHLTRTFAKLDVVNRVQLTIFAFEAGVAGPGRFCRGPPPRTATPMPALGRPNARRRCSPVRSS